MAPGFSEEKGQEEDCVGSRSGASLRALHVYWRPLSKRVAVRCPPISLIGVRSVLSVAGWWVTVVSAVQDQPSGWSGPRFTGRDATLLHPLSKPRVDG
ncbi:unnamed protein product [Boreogadus saida]